MSNNTDVSSFTFYPGSYTGFNAAGTFFLFWGVGNLVGLTLNMNPGARKWVDTKIFCGKKVPVEALWLLILGFCAFFGQLGQAKFDFFDNAENYYSNQNNLRDAFFYLGLGLVGLTQLMSRTMKISNLYSKMFIILPFVTYIVSLSFKSLQTMTAVDYTIFTVQILLFAATAVVLIAEAVYAENAYLAFVRCMSYVYIGVWYLQTANFYWGYTDNTVQGRTYAEEYVLNVFSIIVLMISFFFGVVFYASTRNYDALLTEAKVHAEEQRRQNEQSKKFAPVEPELSLENVEIGLLKP
jgi:hypothetical protein